MSRGIKRTVNRIDHAVKSVHLATAEIHRSYRLATRLLLICCIHLIHGLEGSHHR